MMCTRCGLDVGNICYSARDDRSDAREIHASEIVINE